MTPNTTNSRHQPETEFTGEVQIFSGSALSPDDPSLEPRERKGRPTDVERRPASENSDTQEKE
jgi:hypothetical protein